MIIFFNWIFTVSARTLVPASILSQYESLGKKLPFVASVHSSMPINLHLNDS